MLVGIKRVEKKDLVMCCRCKKQSSVEEWDASTLENCHDKGKRRRYIGLSNINAYTRGADRIYLCPKCKQYCSGYNLTVTKVS